MNKPTGTPWDFSNEYVSPNGYHKLEYGYVAEIGMGGPLSGECFLETNNRKLKLEGIFGGPVVWNNLSDKVAIPFWTKSRLQKLAIIDIPKMSISISERDFRVIKLSKFEGYIVSGIDSPIYRTKKIEFDIEKEKFERTIGIK